MDINVYIILLSAGLALLLILAMVLFRLGRTASPAHGQSFRNEAKLSLWLAVLTAGCLPLGSFNLTSLNPQTVGWQGSWFLIIIRVILWITGITGSIRCLLRMRDIEARIEAEENNDAA